MYLSLVYTPPSVHILTNYTHDQLIPSLSRLLGIMRIKLLLFLLLVIILVVVVVYYLYRRSRRKETQEQAEQPGQDPPPYEEAVKMT